MNNITSELCECGFEKYRHNEKEGIVYTGLEPRIYDCSKVCKKFTPKIEKTGCGCDLIVNDIFKIKCGHTDSIGRVTLCPSCQEKFKENNCQNREMDKLVGKTAVNPKGEGSNPSSGFSTSDEN